MKKNLAFIFLILFLITGCSTKIIIDDNNDGYNEKKVIANNPKFNCSVLDKIKILVASNYVITNDGDLYRMGNFSDNTNCKKVESDAKFNRVIDSFVVDEENNMFTFSEELGLKQYEYPSNYEYILNEPNVIKALSDYGFDNKKIYFLKEDGIIYKGIIKIDNSHGQYKEYLTEVEEYIKYDNEKIIDFSMYFDDQLSWAKTDKSYYRVAFSNPDCNKYDDIKCEYTLIKDEHLTERYSKIAYIYECSSTYDKCNYILKDGGRYEDHLGG